MDVDGKAVATGSDVSVPIAVSVTGKRVGASVGARVGALVGMILCVEIRAGVAAAT